MTNVQLAMSNLLDHFPPLRTHSPQLKLDTKAAPTSKMKWSIFENGCKCNLHYTDDRTPML